MEELTIPFLDFGVAILRNWLNQSRINDPGADGIEEIKEEQASRDRRILKRSNWPYARFRLLSCCIGPFKHFCVADWSATTGLG